MKKVLIVTYYFPPSGGPGVQRVLKFVKYLPEFGWQPVVLTVENGDYPARDESLLREVPGHAIIYRTKIFEPYALYRKMTGKPASAPVDVENIPQNNKRRSAAELFAGMIRSTFFIPDARIGWYPYAVSEGKEIIRSERVDAIYSSSPPYTAAVIARKLHRDTGLPWIAGFRDPWTGFLTTPNRWFFPAAIDRYLEDSVFRDATILEGAWRGILKDMIRKNPSLDRRKLLYLPNGFDREDYPEMESPSNDRFTLCYTGSLYGKRNPGSLLRAVEELVQSGDVDRSKILLKFIGRFGAEVHEMFRSFLLPECLDVRPYIPHAESIAELLKSNALLLIVDEAEGSEEIVPGKVFEYLGAGRTILALAPEGAVAQLIRETSTGFVAPNRDAAAVKQAFLECYREFLYHKRAVEPNLHAIRKYDRREITRHLAALLDSISGPRHNDSPSPA